VRHKNVWMLAASLCFASLASAMDPNRALSQYIRDRWGAEQGFPGGAVYAIAEARDGYLWIGAEKGLVRFDGLNFRLFDHATSPALPAGPVLNLGVSADGDLWIRMQSPSLLRYRGGVFQNISPALATINYPVTAMVRRDNGEVLFSALANLAFQHKGGRLIERRFQTGQLNFTVVSIQETNDGTIWLATRDTGLFSLGEGDKSVVPRGLRDRRITCLLPDGDKDLWIGADTGLVRWDGSRITEDGVAESLRHKPILSLKKDRDSNLWVGAGSGLFRVDFRGVSSQDKAGGMPVTALFEDREGNLWTGDTQGIERFRDNAFVSYSAPNVRQSDGNGPIYADGKDRTWFAPPDEGLFWLRGAEFERIGIAGLDRDTVYSVSGADGNLWLGRQNGGLTHLVETGGGFTAKTYTHADGLAQNTVYTVLRSRDGSVWAGTLSGGVSRFRNERFTTYTSANGLGSNSVSSILEGSDGTIWIATANGMSAFANDGWRTYSGREGLPPGHINCLLEDSKGVLWIGASDGLAFLRSDRVQIPSHAPGLLQEEIFGIAEDGAGWLWITTGAHVLRVEREMLLNGNVGEGDIREYGLRDGLLSTQGVRRDRSVIADSHGRIWFSMNRGVSMVDPTRLTRNPAPALVHIETVAADGNNLDTGQAIRIPGLSQRIIFTYMGLSLSAPERVKYRYMLEGFDRGWSAPTAATEAGYSNLQPRTYRFRVGASNADGVWDGGDASIPVEIEPMFWQTWWFNCAVAAACLLVAGALYRYRLRRLTSELNVRFEERLSERTRIAQELHDTLLQGFLSASMQLHVAVDRMPSDSPAKNHLGPVVDLMNRVIHEGRNTVQGLRSSFSGPPELGQAFSSITQELAIPPEIDFRVILRGMPRPLHPILRDEVYRIGREALVNAFRHSQGSRVEIELEYAPRGLNLSVHDNGRGIDPKLFRSGREGHWGLTGMRERAERIGAQLHVWSNPEGGTEIDLSVPGHVAFRDQREGRLNWFNKWRDRSSNGDREPVCETPQEENRKNK
jgi:signal transduction histidine kinase/ligand-binding sensor domain-containing protein